MKSISAFVVFCDLQNSTALLNELKGRFAGVQDEFFRAAYAAIYPAEGNNEREVTAVLESFLGDGFMFYVKFQETELPKHYQLDLLNENSPPPNASRSSVTLGLIDNFVRMRIFDSKGHQVYNNFNIHLKEADRNKALEKLRPFVSNRATFELSEMEKQKIVLSAIMASGHRDVEGYNELPTGGTSQLLQQRQRSAGELVEQILARIASEVHQMSQGETRRRLGLRPNALGIRFGIAMGQNLLLRETHEILGTGESEIQNRLGGFVLTGPGVNLAARLEHASGPDFLAAIESRRRHLQPFVSKVGDPESLRTSVLSEEMKTVDRQVLDVHTLIEHRFQIRVSQHTKEVFDQMGRRLAWRPLPLEAKGFTTTVPVHVISGNDPDELFRRI